MTWQTYSTMHELGIEVGIAFYEGDDSNFELSFVGSHFMKADKADEALVTLNAMCVKLNSHDAVIFERDALLAMLVKVSSHANGRSAGEIDDDWNQAHSLIRQLQGDAP